VDFDLTNVVFKLSKSIYLGLIINELATNSYKYAFPNQKQGTISLNVKSIDNKIHVLYADSGIGIVDFDQQKQGFGLKLISIMVEQLNGKMEYRFENGFSQFKIIFDEI
jgi:two-component sensor histidine kinase